MRSRMLRGVPEWSGGEDLYMGSCHTDTRKFRGHIGIVPGPPEGFRGSTGRGHLCRRDSWAVVGREPALGGLGASPLGPMRLGLGGGTLKGAPPCLGGQAPFPWPPPLPWRKGQGCASPLSPAPIYSGGEGGHPYLSPWRLPPSRDTSSSPVGAWRSPAGLPCSSTTTTPLCCCWMESSSTSPSVLAGSRHGRRHRAVRVLNAEVPSVRHLIIGDLNHDEYDSINPVHLNASA